MKPESGCSGPQRLLTKERRCGDEEARSGQEKPGGDDPDRRQYVVSQGGPIPKCADPITLVSGLVLDLTPLPRVTCSPGKINQVVLNLLSNAIDATPEGGKVTIRTLPTLITSTGPGFQGIEIHIIDTGRGIDSSIRDRIFDPFFTTKPIGQGTGLGLSLSYGIIHDHGGTINFESFPGFGTHFSVLLPLKRPILVAPDPEADH
jgi:signal transduction histidine kinase